MYERCRASGQKVRDAQLARSVEAASLGSLGNAYDRLKQYDKASEYYSRLLAIAEEIGDPQGVASSLNHLATAYVNLGQYNKAIGYHSRSLAIKTDIGNQLGVVSSLNNLGNAYESLGQYDEAIDYHSRSLAIAGEIGNQQAVASSLNKIGNAYVNLGQYDKAIGYYSRSLAILEEIGNQQGVASSLSSLGNACESLGQHDKAADYHARSLAIAEEMGDPQGIAGSLNGLGIAYDGLGQYDKAIGYHSRSLAIEEEIGNREGVAISLDNLGNTYRRLGQYDKAIDYHSRSLAIAEEIRDRQGVASSLNKLGNAYVNLGQYDKAIGYLSRSLTIAEEIGDRKGVVGSLNNLGNAYDSLGQYEKAIDYYSRSLAISEKSSDQQGVAGSLGNLGIAYRSLRQYDKAIDYYSHSLAIAEEIGDRQGMASSLGNLGNAHLKGLQDASAALIFFERAAAAYDAIWDDLGTDEQRIAYGDSQGPPNTVRGLQRTHARLAQPAKALLAAERARSRAFELLLAQQRVQFGQGQAAAMKPAALDLASLQSLAARQRAALVVFSHIDATTLFAWVVSSGGGASEPVFREISIDKHDKSLGQLVELMRRTLNVRSRHARAGRRKGKRSSAARGAPSPPSDDEDSDEGIDEAVLSTAASSTDTSSLLRRCYELLIAPFADVIAAESSLIIVPDRDLFALPFAALLDVDGKHLIEKHTVRVVPSAGTLIELEQRLFSRPTSDAKLTALVVGDPDFHGWKSKLPGAEAEAKEVWKRLQEQGETTYLSGGEATKANVLEALGACAYVHLATHGAADGVYLSGRTEAEGKLTMAEVQELDLPRARLVVLSECDSFKGELKADGVIGITRAFVAAGAPTLVASLWEVSDIATRKLMTRFYDALLGPEAAGDVAVALQVAMVSMRREGWTVSEWAAFVVYGLASASEVT